MATTSKITLHNADGSVKGTYDLKDDISGYQTLAQIQAILNDYYTAEQADNKFPAKITPITAQNVQAVYPIKIDSQGRITSYGNAVTIPTTTSSVTSGSTAALTSGGAYTALNNKADKVNTTARTTQALYPVTINAQGIITGSGNAVTVPTVNNGTLTIKSNGTTVATFTANSSSNVTANIESSSGATTRSNISVSGTPTAVSYQPWDTEQLYGYKLDVTVNGITSNTLIENIVMTQELLAQVGYVVTTSTNKLTFYFQGNDSVSGTILTLVTSEVTS